MVTVALRSHANVIPRAKGLDRGRRDQLDRCSPAARRVRRADSCRTPGSTPICRAAGPDTPVNLECDIIGKYVVKAVRETA